MLFASLHSSKRKFPTVQYVNKEKFFSPYLHSLFVTRSSVRATRTVFCSFFVRFLFVLCSFFVRFFFVFCSFFLRLLFVFSSSFVCLLYVFCLSFVRLYVAVVPPLEEASESWVCVRGRSPSPFLYLPVRLAPSFVRSLFVFCSSFVRHLFVICSSFVRHLFVFSLSACATCTVINFGVIGIIGTVVLVAHLLT